MAINCVVDTPLLRELHEKVKTEVPNYEDFKATVTLWMNRESEKDPEFDYEVYPTSEEVLNLLPEILSSSKTSWNKSSSDGYEVSSRGDKRFSALYATFKSGTIIEGIDVGSRTIEDVYQSVIKKSKKGQAPSKGSKLYIERNPFNISNVSEEKRSLYAEQTGISIDHIESPTERDYEDYQFTEVVMVTTDGIRILISPKSGYQDLSNVVKNKDIKALIGLNFLLENYLKSNPNEVNKFGVSVLSESAKELYGENYQDSLDAFKSDYGIYINKEDFSYYEGYLPLWQEWAKQNPKLIEDLRIKSSGKTLTDQFANTRVSQARALADILNSTNQTDYNKKKQNVVTKFSVSRSSNYSERTKENAEWSDITMALAVDFTTAGEIHTRRVAKDKYVSVTLNHTKDEIVESLYKQITAKGKTKDIKLNIAGNTISNLPQSQEYYDNLLTEIIQDLQERGITISEIRSGGQTGIDEAGIKAAQRLGISNEVHGTLDWKFRGKDNQDIRDEQAFKERFGIIQEQSDSSKPMQTMPTLAVDTNELQIQANALLGSPQVRRDRVNMIVGAIRKNFPIEFNKQKKYLQDRIENETDEDKKIQLQEQLDTLTEEKAVSVGISNIIARVKNSFRAQNIREEKFGDRTETVRAKMQAVEDNFEILLEEALEILDYTDGIRVSIDIRDSSDTIDEGSGDWFMDDAQKEFDTKDSWMTKARFVDQRDSLSAKVKKLICTTPKVGMNGKFERDDLGQIKNLQSDYVQAILLEQLSKARNAAHFWELLDKLAKQKPWVQSIIDKLNEDDAMKSQFFQNFRKEFMPYWIQVRKEQKDKLGKVVSVSYQTKRINKLQSISAMLDEWRDNYEGGVILHETSIYREGREIDVKAAEKALAALNEISDNYPEDSVEWLDDDSNLEKLMELLHMAGISADSEVVRESLKGEPLDENTERLEKVLDRLHVIFEGVANEEVKKTVQDGVETYDDLLNVFDSAYTVIAKIFNTIPEDSVLSTFREAGKSYQSYSAPSYLGKMINNLKNLEGTEEAFKAYMQKEFLQYRWFNVNGNIRSPWIKKLMYGDDNHDAKYFRDILDRKIVMHSGKLEFNDWGNLEYVVSMLTEYYSNPSEDIAWYYLPLLADAESAEFIRFSRYTNLSEKDASGKYIPYDKLVIRDLTNVVWQEYDRIMAVRQREGKVNPITNYDIIRENDGNEVGIIKDSDGNIISRNTGNEFKFFPALNTYRIGGKLFIDILQKKVENKESDIDTFIKSALAEVMENEFLKFYDTVSGTGALEVVNGKTKYFGTKSEAETIDYLREFFYNNALAQTQMIELTTTDLAFYKDLKDFQKKFKEVYAQTLKLNTQAVFDGVPEGRETGYSVFLKDSVIEAPSKEALNQMLEGRVEAGNLTKLDKDAILNHFNKVNVADAQAYRSLKSYRRVLIMAGRWEREHENAYKRLLDRTWDIQDFNIMFQALKPFMYSQGARPSGIEGYGDIKVPQQYKNSEAVLLSLYWTISSPINKSGKLKAIDEFMDKNDIDVVMFESAVKVGNQAPIDLSGVDSYSDTFNLLNSTIRNEDGTFNKEIVHEFDYEDYGIQVETPEHLIDRLQLFGTQIRKLITSDMSDDIEISIMGSKPLKKQEWWKMYNSLITANIVDAYKEVEEEFSSIEHLAEVIQNELKGNPRYSDEIRQACKLIETVNPITGETEKVFNLPLYDPVQSDRVQHLLNSIIKKKVTKQQIKGGTAIQMTAYGLTDELKIEYEGEGKDRRVKYIECYLPAYAKDFYEACLEVDKEGNKTLNVNKLPEELRRIIGYRIPTENKYSMMPLRIKGFLPVQSGSMIMLPAEVTELTGSDKVIV